MVVNKKILIADDDEIDRRILERWCKQESLLFSACVNGEEAFEKLMTGKFDLLISDLDMPVMDGLELIKRVKKTNLRIPSIAISANEDEKIRLKAIEYGFDYFIPKMSNYKDLGTKISYIIHNRHLLD